MRESHVARFLSNKAGEGELIARACILANTRARDAGHGEGPCPLQRPQALAAVRLRSFSVAGAFQPLKGSGVLYHGEHLTPFLDAGAEVFRPLSTTMQCEAWRHPGRQDKGHSLDALSGGQAGQNRNAIER